jgi:hypothetical protein
LIVRLLGLSLSIVGESNQGKWGFPTAGLGGHEEPHLLAMTKKKGCCVVFRPEKNFSYVVLPLGKLHAGLCCQPSPSHTISTFSGMMRALVRG